MKRQITMQTLLLPFAASDLSDEDMISSDDQNKPGRRKKTSIVELIETVKRFQRQGMVSTTISSFTIMSDIISL